jgi:hypothetical protein
MRRALATLLISKEGAALIATHPALSYSIAGKASRFLSGQSMSSGCSPKRKVKSAAAVVAATLAPAADPHLLERARRISAVLQSLYPDPPCPLDHRDAFTFLCAVVRRGGGARFIIACSTIATVQYFMDSS